MKDTKANGHSVAATIKSKNVTPSWYRECFNGRGADGGWVMRNFDVPEYDPGTLWVADQPWIGAQDSVAINTGGII